MTVIVRRRQKEGAHNDLLATVVETKAHDHRSKLDEG
jgi:hypothetical protein